MTIALIILVVIVGLLAAYIVVSRAKEGRGGSSIDEVVEKLNEAVDKQNEFTQTQINLTAGMAEQVSAASAEKSSKAVGEKLGENFKLIDERFKPLEASLAKYENLINSLKEESSRNQGELTEQLKTVGELNKIFSNTKNRGNWGEAQAENILDSAGFKEGYDYFAQKSFPDPKDPSGRVQPDFTFKLPEGSILHMDAKFSLDNYLKAVEAADDSPEAKAAAKNFIDDVKKQIKGLSGKKYIDTEGSLKQMLMFLPNESAFNFLVENEEGIISFALENNVTLCSPMTLFAILRIIHQSVRTVELQKASSQILNEHNSFLREWEKFTEALEDLGRGMSSTQKKYDALAGTRRNQLQKPIDRIENLKAIDSTERTPKELDETSLNEEDDNLGEHRALSA